MYPEVKRHRFLNNIPGFKRRIDPTRGSQPFRLTDLPDDVLIAVLFQCRIDEIFALRGTCSIFRNVFSTYSVHIIPSVARCTFPGSKLLLEPPTAPSEYNLTWLKERIPLQLATILVDKHRLIFEEQPMGPRVGIAAEDALGTVFRSRVANGWRVLGRLSIISSDIYKLDAQDILSMSNKKATWLMVHTSRYEAEVVRLREELVLQRRLQSIETISMHEAEDYIMMFMLLSGAWRVGKRPRQLSTVASVSKKDPTWPFDFGHGIDAPRMIRKGESWVTWFILRQGPRLFWEQWWSLPSEAPETTDHVRDLAIKTFFSPLRPEDHVTHHQTEFSDPHEELHILQCTCAEPVQRALQEKCSVSARTLHLHYQSIYDQSRRERLVRIGAMASAAALEEPDPTMLSVPFFISFSAHEPAKRAQGQVDAFTCADSIQSAFVQRHS
ncbi:hypothetical protein PMIN01_09557 [Paraphaeosphaeria minitans]|uniref:F-box domain-containing protein n=1 Tax=Paraphaeosphaeria minitans TaxID=565426 RepID=A0A9P6KNM1_9PLEO|nr:hypothetical protein PMIN01_09557 [Paraphaeosphaeria minitans]